MIVLSALVIVAALVWGHFALERNVNRMAQQLQDQMNAAGVRIAELEGEVRALKRREHAAT